MNSVTRKRACFLIALIVYSCISHAQISSSPYSVYGIGVLKGKTSILNRSISGTGIGVQDPLYLNNVNPASYTSIEHVTQIFDIGAYYEADHYQTQNQASTFKTGNITSINYWFRFSKRWAGTIGLSPFSQVDYSVAATNTNSTSISYSGTGGVSQFYFGNGFQISKNISIGINASYIFGSIQKDEQITSGIGEGTMLTNKTSVNRLNVDFGAQYSLFISETKKLTMGLTYDNKLRLNTSNESFIIKATGDTISVDSEKFEDIVLPSHYGAGLSYQTPRSLVAADITFTEWAKAKLEENVTFQNTLRVSAGYIYQGNPNSNSYFDYIQFRAGVYIQDNYLVLSKTTFSDWGFSLGAGFPLNGNRGSVNLTYNFNQSGTIENDLIKQKAQVFSVDFTFRDLWGIKRKFD